ncbi:MAG: YggU family protein [Deltaproteobacteria bacterium]|nr:YggU family protein [Deltaproteobacteria bacterium]
MRPAPDGVSIRVRVQPRASRNEICGVHGGSLKVKLTAPPVEGEANKALIEFLSKFLKIKKSSLSIASGKTSREKMVRAEGVTLEGLKKIMDFT